MPAYTVRINRMIEWEQTYEGDDLSPAAAIELAKLETHHGTIVWEKVRIEDARPAKKAS